MATPPPGTIDLAKLAIANPRIFTEIYPPPKRSTRRWYRHTTPHEFETATGRAKDWGHWLRTADLPWRWWHRVLAWNPCNNIGQLYGCPSPKAPSLLRRVGTHLQDRVDFVYNWVMPEVYSEDKSDEAIVHDGILNMWAREEAAFAQYRQQRDQKRRR